MQSKLNRVKNALLTITKDVFHYGAGNKKDRYIVWAEDNEPGSVSGDNVKQGRTIQGTVDLYTTLEYDPYFQAIEEAFKTAKISFTWSATVPPEEGTGLIHHEWTWEV